MVCLANSYKYEGRCFAGKELVGTRVGGWMRPVSSRPTAELLPSEYQFSDGTVPRLLDIIDVPLLAVAPRLHQTENHLVDSVPWKKVGVFDWTAVGELQDFPTSLWFNGNKTQSGSNDCVSGVAAFMLTTSLTLIKPHIVTVVIRQNSWREGKAFRAIFDYNGLRYNLGVTDPDIRVRSEGEYEFIDPYLCISLTEEYERDERCHKLVAGVIHHV